MILTQVTLSALPVDEEDDTPPAAVEDELPSIAVDESTPVDDESCAYICVIWMDGRRQEKETRRMRKERKREKEGEGEKEEEEDEEEDVLFFLFVIFAAIDVGHNEYETRMDCR